MLRGADARQAPAQSHHWCWDVQNATPSVAPGTRGALRGPQPPCAWHLFQAAQHWPGPCAGCFQDSSPSHAAAVIQLRVEPRSSGPGWALMKVLREVCIEDQPTSYRL